MTSASRILRISTRAQKRTSCGRPQPRSRDRCDFERLIPATSMCGRRRIVPKVMDTALCLRTAARRRWCSNVGDLVRLLSASAGSSSWAERNNLASQLLGGRSAASSGSATTYLDLRDGTGGLRSAASVTNTSRFGIAASWRACRTLAKDCPSRLAQGWASFNATSKGGATGRSRQTSDDGSVGGYTGITTRPSAAFIGYRFQESPQM